MRRYILTGAPGAGKTAIVRALEAQGFDVVEEAATDVIALEQARGVPEPWTSPHAFVGAIAALQARRRIAAAGRAVEVQFHDRSPVCTLALARFLDAPVPRLLTEELERIAGEGAFQRDVFFVQGLGFIEPTPARRISYEEALRFERFHEEAYRELGYAPVPIAPARVDERVAAIASMISSRN